MVFVIAAILGARRGDALHALAMLVDAGESLPEGIERLATDDPALRRCARVLAPRLRNGERLGAALRACRMIGKSEAIDLDTALDPAEMAHILARIADGENDPTPGYALVRWLPVWLTAAALLPACVFSFAVRVSLGHALESILRDMGITVPETVNVFFRPLWQMPADAACVLLASILVVWVLSEIRPLRHVLHLWCPEVHRAAAAARLARAARIAVHEPRAISPVRWVLWWVGLGVRSHRPAWDVDWRTWMFLTRFRLRSADRRLLRRMPDLRQRSLAVGWDPDAPDGDDEARKRFIGALAAARPLVLVTLFVVAILGWTMWFLFPMVALLRLFGQSI